MVTHLDNRQKLIRCATDEIYRRGEHGARVDKIAALARLNKRLIYHYFGDKMGLEQVVLAAQVAILTNAAGHVSAVTRQLLRELTKPLPADDRSGGAILPDSATPGPQELHMAVVIVLRRLFVLGTDLQPLAIASRPWALACVELMSMALPQIAAQAFGVAPGQAGLAARCERLLQTEKPRYRLKPDVRY